MKIQVLLYLALAAPSFIFSAVELRIEGLGWQDPPGNQIPIRTSYSNGTLTLFPQQEGGKKISVTPVSREIYADHKKWKTLSTRVRRAPDVQNQRLTLEDASGKPLLYICKNEKRAFHPLTGWEVETDGDLDKLGGSGRMRVRLRFTPSPGTRKTLRLAPGESGTIFFDTAKWTLHLLEATRSLPSPAARSVSDEEAPLLFDFLLQRLP